MLRSTNPYHWASKRSIMDGNPGTNKRDRHGWARLSLMFCVPQGFYGAPVLCWPIDLKFNIGVRTIFLFVNGVESSSTMHYRSWWGMGNTRKLKGAIYKWSQESRKNRLRSLNRGIKNNKYWALFWTLWLCTERTSINRLGWVEKKCVPVVHVSLFHSVVIAWHTVYATSFCWRDGLCWSDGKVKFTLIEAVHDIG